MARSKLDKMIYAGAEKDAKKKNQEKNKGKYSAATTLKDGRPVAPELATPLNNKSVIAAKYSIAKAHDKYGPITADPSLTGMVDQRIGGITPDQRGMDALRSQAYGAGPSPWMSKELARNTSDTDQAVVDTYKSGMGAAGQVKSALARRQGLTSGAASRIGQNAMRDTSLQQQKFRAQGALNAADIGMTDASNREQLIRQMPGMETDMANFDLSKRLSQFQQKDLERDQTNKLNQLNFDNKFTAYGGDIQSAISALGDKTQYGKIRSGQSHAEWAAGKQADAIASQKKKDPIDSLLGGLG